MNPPTTIDTATFDDYCSVYGSGCDATIDVNIDIDSILMKSDYTGTITQSGANTINLGSNNRNSPHGVEMDAGTFVGGSGNITMDVLQLTAGTFTATSGELRIGYNAQYGYTEDSWVRAGVTWAHNNGTVIFDPTGNNTANRKNMEIELDQKWVLYNMEFDVDSSTLSSGRYQGHYMEIRGTSATMEVHNELHFRDGRSLLGTIEFYGADARFHCDSPTFDKCSDGQRGYNGIDPTGAPTLIFMGSSAQTYTFDVGARSWLRFEINNANGVTPGNANDISIMALNIVNGNFTAPSGTLTFSEDTDYSWRGNNTGFEIGATGTWTHNNGHVIIGGKRTYNDGRDAFRLHDDATFYDLTVDFDGDYDGNEIGQDWSDVVLDGNVTVLNDLRVQNGRFNGNSVNIYVQGDYYRECAALEPDHDCASPDEGTLTYIFDTAGSNIYVDAGADQYSAGSGVHYTFDPGASNTVTIHGVLTLIGSDNDVTVTSGTLNMNTNGGIIAGDDLTNNSAVTCTGSGFINYRGSLGGTPGAGNNSACYGAAPSDNTISMNWANFTGNSSVETVSSVFPGVALNMAVSHSGGNVGTVDVSFRNSHTGWSEVADGANADFTVVNAETVAFSISGTDSGDTATITITNTSNGGATVDTITATVP